MPDEAKLILELSALPEPVGNIYKRLENTGISKVELEGKLDDLVIKGAILDGSSAKQNENRKLYGKAIHAIGIYE